jgi:uncharacterized damage-inducible protein DinB
MLRTIHDFLETWAEESAITRKLFGSLTQDSLAQEVVPGGRTIGRIAWHLTVSLGDLTHRLGLGIDCPTEEGDVPPLATIVSTYEQAAASLAARVRDEWTDDHLARVFDMFGERWTGAQSLEMLLRHEVHHRGQLTILMRQAGVTVPGVYGPAREEWAQWGMTAPA